MGDADFWVAGLSVLLAAGTAIWGRAWYLAAGAFTIGGVVGSLLGSLGASFLTPWAITASAVAVLALLAWEAKHRPTAPKAPPPSPSTEDS
jgi:hypothetical protein